MLVKPNTHRTQDTQANSPEEVLMLLDIIGSGDRKAEFVIQTHLEIASNVFSRCGLMARTKVGVILARECPGAQLSRKKVFELAKTILDNRGIIRIRLARGELKGEKLPAGDDISGDSAQQPLIVSNDEPGANLSAAEVVQWNGTGDTGESWNEDGNPIARASGMPAHYKKSKKEVKEKKPPPAPEQPKITSGEQAVKCMEAFVQGCHEPRITITAEVDLEHIRKALFDADWSGNVIPPEKGQTQYELNALPLDKHDPIPKDNRAYLVNALGRALRLKKSQITIRVKP